jgi:hypothetical protein
LVYVFTVSATPVQVTLADFQHPTATMILLLLVQAPAKVWAIVEPAST